MERHLTGKEAESWELIYLKVFKTQLPMIEQSLETASLILGSDKSRGSGTGSARFRDLLVTQQ